MGKVIYDQYTGLVVDLADAIHALPRVSARVDMALRKASTELALDASSAPQPGGPWCGLSVDERIECMTAAKTGGAFAEALEMQERGYAVGHIPG